MAIYAFRTKTYANAIYVFGTNRLSAEDNYPGIASEYYAPIEEYAAQTYTQDQLDIALANGWISQQEYDESMSYKVQG